jgi:hypothetical protein
VSAPNSQPALVVLAAGVLLGAVASALSFAAFLSAQPAPRAPEPTPVVCTAGPACPACPECPAPVDPMAARPEVREPPLDQSGSAVMPAPSGQTLSARECERARTRPMQVSDDKLAECARQNLLGTCHIAPACPTCVCKEYVSVDQLCQDGKCGSPLDGTGCVSGAYYGAGNYFFNCSGPPESVAGCMVRKLAKAGYCKPRQ